MIMKVFILCGGLGTRLRSVVKDTPKPMAPVLGRPFLSYLMDSFSVGSVTEFILCVGYKREQIIDHFGKCYKDISISYSIEEEPLLTGGALQKAFLSLKSSEREEPVLVINGDTFVKFNLPKMLERFNETQADLVMLTKKLESPDRYGTVILDKDERILGFKEKTKKTNSGLINAGVYLFKPNLLINFRETPFSFERDFLEPNVGKIKVVSFETFADFIDIGVQSDYARCKDMLLSLSL